MTRVAQQNLGGCGQVLVELEPHHVDGLLRRREMDRPLVRELGRVGDGGPNVLDERSVLPGPLDPVSLRADDAREPAHEPRGCDGSRSTGTTTA